MGPDSGRGFARQRLVATALLVAMGAVFLATHLVEPAGFWLGLVRSGAEAALVGGLADWFAVTALFRHPLGLPIPHTAIVPNNKDRIGAALGRFVEQNFLDPELVGDRIGRADLAAGIGNWLADPRRSRLLAHRLGVIIPRLIDTFEDREMRGLVHTALERQLAEVDLSRLIGQTLSLLRGADRDRQVLDRALDGARKYLAANEARIYEMVEQRSRWWVPNRVDRRVASGIVRGVLDLLTDLSDRDSDARRRLDTSLDEWIDGFLETPEFRDRVAALKTDLLASEPLQEYLGAVWDRTRDMLLDDMARHDSTVRDALARALQSLGESLRADVQARNHLNRRLTDLARSVIVPWRGEIANFIADVVRGWDARTVSDRLEMAVGRDLQYIRMNGTIVGAIVGCLLYLAVTASGA